DSESQEAWPGAEQRRESLREPRSKRRKAGAPPTMARSRAADKARKFACTCLRMRGQWLACAFRRFASLYLQGASQFLEWRGGHDSDAEVRREDEILFSPLRAGGERSRESSDRG